MIITLSASSLQMGLQTLSRIIPSKSSLPILTCYLFEISENNLRLTASNTEGRMSLDMDCMCEGSRAICVPYTFIDGLKTLPEQPISIEIGENDLITVRYNGGKFEVMGLSAEAYPKAREIRPCGELTLLASDMLQGIRQVINQTSDKDLRPVLHAVNIERDAHGDVFFVGTNGQCLGSYRMGGQEEGEARFLISRGMASIIRNVFPDSAEPVSIVIGEEWSEMRQGSLYVQLRNVEGRYPNWRAVIPPRGNMEMVADKRLLVSAIKRVSVFSNRLSNMIEFIFDHDKLTLASKDIDFSTSAEENLRVDFSGDTFSIGLSGIMLQDMLSGIQKDMVRMSFIDRTRAVLLTPVGEEEGRETIYLLMPISIQ